MRDEYGGASIFDYGGGGQGNHLGGAYAGATRSALGVRFTSNAIAQEKTGELWIDAHLFGHATHTAPDFERAQVAVFVGKNPWMAHGFPHARTTLKAIAADPDRTLIVIDPRRSETAELADIHLRVRPGGDAFLLSAMLAVLVQEDLLDHAFLEQHAQGHEDVVAAVRGIDVEAYCGRAGVPVDQAREAAQVIGTARSVSILEDLGIQQAPHSTLSSYLEKLLWALTGNFARAGATNLHTQFSPGGLVGRSRESRRRTPGTGERVIGGMFPAAAIPDAVLTDDPDRFRAAIIESSNPVHSLPDSPRMREAMAALDFSVVIDITMTETAQCADYVLPAPTQYEKYECTFFNLEFPENGFSSARPSSRRRWGRSESRRSTAGWCALWEPCPTRTSRACMTQPGRGSTGTRRRSRRVLPSARTSLGSPRSCSTRPSVRRSRMARAPPLRCGAPRRCAPRATPSPSAQRGSLATAPRSATRCLRRSAREARPCVHRR